MKRSAPAKRRLAKRAREQIIVALLQARYALARMLTLKTAHPDIWGSDTAQARAIREQYAAALRDKSRMEALPDDLLLSERAEQERQHAEAQSAMTELERREHEARRALTRRATEASRDQRAALRAKHDGILQAEVLRLLAESATQRAPATKLARIILERQRTLWPSYFYTERTLLNKVRAILKAQAASQ